MIAIHEGSRQGTPHNLVFRSITTIQEGPLVGGDALIVVDPVTSHKRERHGRALHRQFNDALKCREEIMHGFRETDDSAGGTVSGNMVASLGRVVAHQTDILIGLVGVAVKDGPSGGSCQVRDT